MGAPFWYWVGPQAYKKNKQADSGPARGETWGKMKGKEEEKSR